MVVVVVAVAGLFVIMCADHMDSRDISVFHKRGGHMSSFLALFAFFSGFLLLLSC